MKDDSLNQLLEKCLDELKLAYNGDCPPERAERNAALFLEMQMRLAGHVSDAELKAKMAKNECERMCSEKYFEYKGGGGGEGKKMTEAALEHAVTKDEAVFKIKEDIIRNEAEYKKWNYIINTLSNGHIFYRNLGKREFGM